MFSSQMNTQAKLDMKTFFFVDDQVYMKHSFRIFFLHKEPKNTS